MTIRTVTKKISSGSNARYCFNLFQNRFRLSTGLEGDKLQLVALNK